MIKKGGYLHKLPIISKEINKEIYDKKIEDLNESKIWNQEQNPDTGPGNNTKKVFSLFPPFNTSVFQIIKKSVREAFYANSCDLKRTLQEYFDCLIKLNLVEPRFNLDSIDKEAIDIDFSIITTEELREFSTKKQPQSLFDLLLFEDSVNRLLTKP